jgi:hypothetical protein
MVRMVRIVPLPGSLVQTPFTVYESRALGVRPKRLRAHDLSDGGRLIYLPAGRHLEIAERVALGDQLIRQPRPSLELRSEPYAYKDGLRLLIRQHPNMKGVEKARLALEEMRVGADSFPETFLRLALLDARLPEPELQLRLDPDDRRSPAADLGYRRFRLAVQYDGAPHLTREQQSKDNRRDEAFRSAGWAYFKANADDLAEGFETMIARIKRSRIRPV